MKNKSYVIYNLGMSLDGKIATTLGETKFSSEEDLDRVHALRSQVDGIMVGIGTILSDNPRLNVRRGKQAKKNLATIVVDSKCRIPLDANVFKNGKTLFLGVSKNSPPEKIKLLKKQAVHLFFSDREPVHLEKFMEFLYTNGLHKILLEGGGTLGYEMLFRGLVDELQVSLSPVILGSKGGISLAEGKGVERIFDGVQLELISTKSWGKSLVLCYHVL